VKAAALPPLAVWWPMNKGQQKNAAYFAIIGILNVGIIVIVRGTQVHLTSYNSRRLLASLPLKHCYVAVIRYEAQQRKTVDVHVRPTGNTVSPVVHAAATL